MVEGYTQNLRRDGSISRGTKERYHYTTSVDVNTRYKRIHYCHSFRITCDMCAVSLLESRE